jgi:hypothetical protein
MQKNWKIVNKKSNKFFLRFVYFFVPILLNIQNLKAQNISLEKSFLHNYLREKQLIDLNEYDYSFAIRPVTFKNNIDSSLLISKRKNYFHTPIDILPISFSSIYNSHHPFGFNQGAMIPSQSPELYLSTGIYAVYKKWEFQFQPEFIYTANNQYETFAHENYDPIWYSYYKWLNKIDAPEQFGITPYFKSSLGQSKIQYNFNSKISASLSNQNIWWGPGIQNSLVLTNNAAGFQHFSLQTNKPYKTKIGSFESQILIGKLDNSDIPPPDTNRVMNAIHLYTPKLNQWRFFSGYIITWQPKWIPNLYVGSARAAITYNNNFKILDLLPLSANENYSVGSMFFRYILKESRAEFYGEYGNNDNNNQRGYVFGFQKISHENKHHLRFIVNAEIAQLDATSMNQILNATSWYTSSTVTQGYTQLGKVLGAGIGPGSNSQMLDISLIKGKNKFGVTFQRLVHNNDFYYNAYYPINYWKAHWIDMSALYHTSILIKNQFYVNASFGIIRSLNYDWRFIPLIDPVLPGNGYDPLNLHANLSIIYHWPYQNTHVK